MKELEVRIREIKEKIASRQMLTIKPFMEINEDGILIINDKYKFQDGKWFFYGYDGKWYFLGVGANPNIEDDGSGIINKEIYDNVFEEITE